MSAVVNSAAHATTMRRLLTTTGLRVPYPDWQCIVVALRFQVMSPAAS
jgi:hypothetical protein